MDNLEPSVQKMLLVIESESESNLSKYFEFKHMGGLQENYDTFCEPTHNALNNKSFLLLLSEGRFILVNFMNCLKYLSFCCTFMGVISILLGIF